MIYHTGDEGKTRYVLYTGSGVHPDDDENKVLRKGLFFGQMNASTWSQGWVGSLH